MSTIIQRVFTDEITNTVFVTTPEMSIRAISVFCSSETSGSILGGANLGGNAPSSLTISQNKAVTFQVKGTGVLDVLTITAPLGCTLQIIALS